MALKLNYYLLIILFYTLIFSGYGCQFVQKRLPVKKNGKIYGVIQGPFQDQWWHYYQRGLSFADGECWDEAKLDLNEALKRRNKDKRRARTYGMHFISYFPNREIGVILFRQGHYEDAIKYLTLSLDMVKTSKAAYYIDKSRLFQINQKDIDHQPPVVVIPSVDKTIITDKFNFEIQGTAIDDTFVRHIQVNDKALRIDVSNSKINFRTNVTIVTGKNNIQVKCTDLTGKSLTKKVLIYGDHLGPVFELNSIRQKTDSLYKQVQLTGKAFDDSGISEIIINEKIIKFNGLKYVQIQEELKLGIHVNKLIIKVKDIVKNITYATVYMHKMNSNQNVLNSYGISKQFITGLYQKRFPHPMIIKQNQKICSFLWTDSINSFYSFNFTNQFSVSRIIRPFHHPMIRFQYYTKIGNWIDLFKWNTQNIQDDIDVTAPEITITFPEKLDQFNETYSDILFINGEINDKEGNINNLWIEGVQCLKNQFCKKSYFSYKKQLHEGDNFITIRVEDCSKNTNSKTIKVKKLIKNCEKIGSRLKLAIFQQDKLDMPEQNQINLKIEHFLLKELQSAKRFVTNILRFGENIERNKSNALISGQKQGLDCLLSFHSIIRDDKNRSLEILAGLEDIEIFKPIANIDVYGENSDTDTIKKLAFGLSELLSYNVPRIEGNISEVLPETKEIEVDKGRLNRIKEGMQYIAFQIDQVLPDINTSASLNTDYTEYGLLRIKNVKENTSVARADHNTDINIIHKNYKVITK